MTVTIIMTVMIVLIANKKVANNWLKRKSSTIYSNRGIVPRFIYNTTKLRTKINGMYYYWDV